MIKEQLIIPDSIYLVKDQTIHVPIENNTNYPLQVKPEEIKVFGINLKSKERIHYITQEEYFKRLKLLKENIRVDHMEKENREVIGKILMGYNDVFTLPGDLIPSTQLTTHKIVVKTPKPINIKSYRPPECHREEIKRQMEEMLTKGIIEPSDSPYNSPI